MRLPDGLRDVSEARPFPIGPSTVEQLWQERDPSSIAIVDDDTQWTTGELRAEVDRVARCLVRDGVSAGDRVGWVTRNDRSAIVGLLATIRIAALWVGVHPRSTATERTRLAASVGPIALLESLPDGTPDPPLPPPPPPAMPAAIAMTSGTTGSPKGAVHSQQQLLYPAAAAMATEPLSSSSRIGTPLPLSTLNILLLGPLTALACGGTSIVLRRTDPQGFATDLRQFAVTRALVVPTIVHDLVEHGTDPALLETVERFILGGSGIDRARARLAARTLRTSLWTSYGLSEAPTGVARMTVDDDGAAALPGIEIDIRDGEITLAPERSGPWRSTWQGTLGYWGDAVLTDRLWHDGRLHTGDAGSLDEGLLAVHGRMADMIDRGGALVSPAEVEAVLCAQPGVAEAAVFGVDDARLGQVVAAAVVGAVEPDALARDLRQTLSGYKVPQRWLFVDRLPRNRNGKVDRRDLRRSLDER